MLLQISSTPSFGTHGDDVARVQQAIQALGRDVSAAERAQRVFGPDTAAVLKALQGDLGVPVTGVVDAPTVRNINSKLAALATDARVIRGSVRDPNGNPVITGSVEIFSQGPAGEQPITKSPLNPKDGSYAISYQPPPGSNGRVDLRVAVLDGADKPVETTPSGASILTDAGPLEVIDFVVSGTANPPKSEFELILGDLQPLLGTRNIADLTKDTTGRLVSILASQSIYSADQVVALALAHKLQQDTGTRAEIFYGLLRQGQSWDADALYAAHKDVLGSALDTAVGQGVIPAELDGKKVEDVLTGLAPRPGPELQSLLHPILNVDEIAIFLDQYLKSSQDPDAFWKGIAADPRFAARADKLKDVVRLSALTNNHVGLIAAVQALPEIKQPADLVSLTKDRWKSLIQAPGVGVPPDTPGANAAEQTENYANQILAQVEAAFPTLFFAKRLTASPVATFLQDQSFDLKTTYLPRFLKDLPAAANALTPADRQQLQTFQRVYRLTDSAADTIALAPRFASADRIARVDPGVFADQNKDILSADRAAEIHGKAVRMSALARSLWIENYSGLNRTALQALPKLDSQKQAGQAASSIPDWENLFGAFDFCACEDCASVQGPAAYFVDILEFLSERQPTAGNSPKDVLVARRPDLGDIELSCENTNTALPLIDLVNEILEDTVAPPAPFVPFALAAALEADLAQTVATPALAAAFTPPLKPGVRVEALTADSRWRIWDEPFAYTVVKDNTALEVAARSRQTAGSPAERLATPQYRNSTAYDQLGQSVYPWSLPFDLPGAEAKVFLSHLGVARRDLIAALRPLPDPFDPNSPVVVRMAAERLGLSATERKIIVGEALTPPRQPEDFWGSDSAAALATVQELLDRSGLAYAELDALIATWFVNPAKAVTISAKPGAPIDTCDTTQLQLDNLTAEVLSRMVRFVRLWRRLGWTVPEVDKAIRAVGPDPDTPTLNNQVIVRLDHVGALCSQLRLSVVQTLALWKPIDTAEPRSLYHSLFYNPAIFKSPNDDFRLTADGKELADTHKALTDDAAALQAAFRLNSDSFALLVATTDGRLDLANLSLIYRHALLVQRLGVTVADLLTIIDLTGLEPFQVERSQDTLRLVEVVRAVGPSGFGIAQLDYLLRHRFNPAAPFVPTEPTLAQILTDVRTDLLKVDAPSDAEKQKLQQSAIVGRLATATGLPADVTGDLLSRVVHGGETAVQRFLELSTNSVQPLSRDNARPQFETLEKLLKIAGIIQLLQLPGSQLDWLFRENPWLAPAPDPQPNPVPLASWFSLIQVQQLRQDLGLQDAAVEAILGAVSAVATAADPTTRIAAKAAFVGALVQWLGWTQEDLETLLGKSNNLTDLGLLSVRFPDDYHIALIVRLDQTMSLVKRLAVTAAVAGQWCGNSLSDANAKAIRAAAKAKYDEASWQTIVTPLQNSLRDKQREALLAYLVAQPAKWAASGETADANHLFSHFLIDVEMSSCQLTSRIKQAIGSVQLFTQRCRMGLESGVQTDHDPKWGQWDWMKSLPYWAANRKIWLYPENWIEPELRDDKSPFFKDLENELLQSDLDGWAAEQAFLHYLEKLDDVARLEIVGVYQDDDDDGTLHVFGRTFNTPRIYYYRCIDGATKAWTPWEKVELDIEGDHLIPVIWNRKLMLIWAIFTDKTEETPVVMPAPGNKLNSANHYWEIQLAWSQYQNGRWTGKKLSDPVSFTAYQGEDDILFGERVLPPVNKAVSIRLRKTDGNPTDTDPSDDGGEGPQDPGTHIPPVNGPSAVPRRLVGTDRISFNAMPSGDTLVIRGFLRRDYRGAPDTGDWQIACPFGEFRFSSCRNIVTTAYGRLMEGRQFLLAPTGTAFDHMWFKETASGLTLFDGQFPAARSFPPVTVLDLTNEPASIAGDPSALLKQKNDIPVLDQTPSLYRILAPHQGDRQFVDDRPCFFMGGNRNFIVASTGKSGNRSQIIGDWVNANIATALRADYFPSAAPTGGTGSMTNGADETSASLTVLVHGPAGQRVEKVLTPIDLTPAPSPRTLVSTFWTTRQYRFTNFSHPYVCEFIKTLDRQGIPGLMSLDTQSMIDPGSFDNYKPEPRVPTQYPIDEVEFQSGGAYELYNWELFFHIPLLIANALFTNQHFEDAERWFRFIFDPTASSGAIPQRYWRFKPANDRLRPDYEAQSVKDIEEMMANGPSDALKVAVDMWRSNPFNPYAVARLRTTAFQKTVVMKYIDNLIGWGDQLFRMDTIESINEATQLYVLAAEILGRRPEIIQRNLKPAAETFNSLAPKLDALGNALEQIELLVPDAGAGSSTVSSPTPDLPSNAVLYFCVPENDKLLGYWSTIEDRLFNIRHCKNIEGQVQQLPLFEPPIDPALLVRAQAAGLSITDILSDISVSLPNYRFAVMLQKGNEMVAEVRNLGAALMSALEKRDAEALSTLRSGQELRLLQAMQDIRKKQIDDANANIAALQQSQQMAQARKDYYESRDFISITEGVAAGLAAASLSPLAVKLATEAIAAFSHLLPNFKVGAPTTIGAEDGGTNTGSSSQAVARQQETGATILNVTSMLTAKLGEYLRRQDEWDHQANLATIELKQIEQQLAAAEIRLAIAQQELDNHNLQTENARDVDQFLRSKFTNQDLFQWTIGQVSSVYFQSYQLAYDLAKRAELCMQHELGLEYGETSFIRFGYWDSLKKGLLAGERLAYDLKRLDTAYLDGNVREYELTKHISLLSLAPEQLIALKETGSCEFKIPEWLFDLDTPGHYRRRIRMMEVIIPAVTGPYTAMHCKAQLLKSSFRQSTGIGVGYDRRPADDPSGPDNRFVDDRTILAQEGIVTSTAQNDAGLFEPSLRDERYLPFEGAGAISRWRLELPMTFKMFDYSTITDIVIKLFYTARDGGDALRAAAISSVKTLLAGASGPLYRMFSLRHEYPSEWYQFVSSPTPGVSAITIDLAATRFPYFVQTQQITVMKAQALASTKADAGSPTQVAIAPGPTAPDPTHGAWSGQSVPGPWTVSTSSDPKLLAELFVILEYGASLTRSWTRSVKAIR